MPDRNESLRLAICTGGELFGGVERQVLDLGDYARRRTGRPPLLVLFHDRELARQARSRGTEPAILGGRHRYDPALAAQVAEKLRAERIDVVHAHGYKAMIACALARRRWRGAVVKTEHGKIEATPRDPVAWMKMHANGVLDALASRRAAAICYVTDDVRRHCDRTHAGLRRVTIPNGISPLEKDRTRRPEELEPGAQHLGVVGRLTPVKGIEVALRALAAVRGKGRVRLTILGEGPLAEPLARQAAALGVADRVRFLGFRAGVSDFIAHFDALLMPSWHEGLPYVLLEAMAFGTPVFASRVGGLAEVLRDGETAALFPAGDSAALSGLISRLLAEPTWAAGLGQAARADQRSRFTLERMGVAYWEVYLAAGGGVRAG
jgi:glycosyltransferase involved in cell wall biosynthesis